MAKNEAEAEPQSRRCRVCGAVVDKLYQNSSCKSCLVHSFKKLVPIIDLYRSGKAASDQGA